MKLGSLFDGSGGFPLAGAIHGISPAWASEIEPYPIRVTKARFPQMKHLGSVLDVNGAEVEPVDIITFGSPCQDLSVAGLRSGIHTEGGRSNLFFEAIRIIKEMRNATDNTFPRIAIWENVPGAYSSNKGEDFRAVLEAFAQINDEAADVPRPASGKWNPAGAIVGNGWSIAWRTFDAQYWGVPQRRKRIYLIADFGSERAGEILFEQKGLRGHSEESGTAGQGAAGDAEGSAGRGGFGGIFFKERAGCPGGGKGILCGDKPFTLSTLTDQAVCYAIEPGAAARLNTESRISENTCPTLRANAGDNQPAVCYPIDLIRESRGAFETYEQDADKAGSLKQCDNKGSQVVCYAVRTRNTMANGWGVAENAYTLDTSEGQAVAYSADSVCYAIDRASFNQGINAKYDICIEPELNSPLVARGPSAVCYPIDSHQQDSRFKVCADCISPTLPGQMGTGGNNGPTVLETTKPPRKYIIRRLTPLECCRLQGFPDWWEDGVQGSDSARYKMWGNGIALPNAAYVIGCAKKLIQEA